MNMTFFQALLTVLAVIGGLFLLFVVALAVIGLFGGVFDPEEKDGYDEEAEILKNFDSETGERRREFSEPATDARIEGREILAPRPQQYSDLPPQWSLNDDAWLPPEARGYTGDLMIDEVGYEPAPGVNGQPVLEETSDAQAKA